MVPEIESALHDLLTGDIILAIESLVELVKEIPNLLSDCRGMSDDITAIKQWATIFGSKTRLVATISKNYLLHKRAVKADIDLQSEQWAQGQYFLSGTTAADILTTLIGPIEPNYEMMAKFNAKTVPDFIAGFIYGMTGDNDLTEIEACY